MNKQPKQLIEWIHLENMGFLENRGVIPRSYYKEYGGLRLDAIMSDGINTIEKQEGWNIVIFHKTDSNKITVIRDLNLFIELNNLLNKIHASYDETKSH